MTTINNVFIFINAIVIALMAMYIYQNERKMERISARHKPTDDQAGYLLALKFDRMSTHSLLFMSDDNTVLGNTFTKETPNPVNYPEQFNNYKGTIGDRCLTSTISFNNERGSMDVASDYCDNVKNERQVNTLQGTTTQVKNVHEPCQIAMQLNEGVGRVTTEPRTTRNVWIRLKQHKWSILAFFVGVILTLGIVVPVMVSKSSPTKNGGQGGYLFSLKFDRKSTHSLLFMSDDNKVLGNAFTKETPNPVNHSKQFNNYKGTIGDRCLTSTSKIYFEVKFLFKILKSLNYDSTLLVLEVGVASRKEIDSKHYVGNHGWSFFINNCNTSICLIAKHGTTNTREEVKMIDTTNSVGRVDTGILGFFVNMDRNDYSVIDKDSSNILYTFTKVVSADQLCLAFGVYNPKTFETKLEIMYAYDFKNLPIINVIA